MKTKIKFQNKEKDTMRILKTYFIIINLIIATIAFASLISAVDEVYEAEQKALKGVEVSQDCNNKVGCRECVNKCIDLKQGGGQAGFARGLAEGFNPFGMGFFNNLAGFGGFIGAGYTIAKLSGTENAGKYGLMAGAVGFGTSKIVGAIFQGINRGYGTTFFSPQAAIVVGAAVGLAVLFANWKKTKYQEIEFNCLPWKPPVGGQDCDKCNLLDECSEYACKSLGQACEIVNKGTKEQKCTWKNPGDVQSPSIKVMGVTGYKMDKENKMKINYTFDYKPLGESERPTLTGIRIFPQGEEPTEENIKNGKGCLEAYTPFEFSIITNEVSQCKMSSMLTNSTTNLFEEMSYYINNDNSFSFNHTEKLSMPNPNDIEKVASKVKDDGVYTEYIRCQDVNGNFNVDPFVIRFCINKGPDTTPPIIEKLDIPSGMPILFNQSNVNLSVYLNEPVECRWDRVDKPYENMVNNMCCTMDCGGAAEDFSDANVEGLYTCIANLTGIEDRKENDFFFRCIDQPDAEDEADRNVNKQSYLYKLIGTQPLNILEISPNDTTIKGATSAIPVELEVRTDNGFKKGESTCSFYNDIDNLEPTDESQYIDFLVTGTNRHKQSFDLTPGVYTYFIKCVDLGGNAAYGNATFATQTDTQSPLIIRAYKESDSLKIISNEDSECTYSVSDCNYEVDNGIKMSSFDKRVHTSEWKAGQNYYIRCKDKYNRQPDPNTCSIIVKPYEIYDSGTGNAIEL